MKPYYEAEGCTIYHGDFREFAPLPESGCVLVTDPPYGIGFESHGQRFKGADRVIGDGSTEAYSWLRKCGLPVVAFYSPFAPIDGWRSVLVWDKGEDTGIGGDRATCWKRDFELIGVSGNGPLEGQRDSALLRFRARARVTDHPSEKPVPLMKYLIRKACPLGALILDPFMGSGTTLRAAKDLGRKAIGIEIEERYCEIAAKRLNQIVLTF